MQCLLLARMGRLHDSSSIQNSSFLHTSANFYSLHIKPKTANLKVVQINLITWLATIGLPIVQLSMLTAILKVNYYHNSLIPNPEHNSKH